MEDEIVERIINSVKECLNDENIISEYRSWNESVAFLYKHPKINKPVYLFSVYNAYSEPFAFFEISVGYKAQLNTAELKTLYEYAKETLNKIKANIAEFNISNFLTEKLNEIAKGKGWLPKSVINPQNHDEVCNILKDEFEEEDFIYEEIAKEHPYPLHKQEVITLKYREITYFYQLHDFVKILQTIRISKNGKNENEEDEEDE